MSEPFRLNPALPAHAYKRYSIASPISTHTRAATCAEVECDEYLHGWATTIDLEHRLPNGLTGRDQADYIRARSGRRFTELRISDSMISFRFEPGQAGFGHEHRVPLDRPEWFLVKPGDHRVRLRPDEIFKHSSADSWVDDFATHQQRLDKAINGG